VRDQGNRLVTPEEHMGRKDLAGIGFQEFIQKEGFLDLVRISSKNILAGRVRMISLPSQKKLTVKKLRDKSYRLLVFKLLVVNF
jgi:hypothetical protein